MMEKRNFVTSVRTPDGTGPSEIDNILDEAASAMKPRIKKANAPDSFEKRASKKDEESDSAVM